MLDNRLSLHEELVDILGSRHVYYQPPENVKMEYPCFVYNLSRLQVDRANNKPYFVSPSYTVTYIDEDPDSDIPKIMVNHFLHCSMSRSPYVVDGLNHWVFEVFN